MPSYRTETRPLRTPCTTSPGITVGQVVEFIVETVTNATHEISVFKLSNLVKLYNAQLKLGVHLENRIHSTRFKIRLLSQFEDMFAYNDKKKVILAFNCDVAEVITTAAAANYDDDGNILPKGATILRRQETQHLQIFP